MVDVNAKPGVDLFLHDYIAYLGAAMYKALENVSRFQGPDSLRAPLLPGVAAGDPNYATRYDLLAWQFAANVCDYRDSDSVPTIIEVDLKYGDRTRTAKIYGLEQQPFLTEAYRLIHAPREENPSPPPPNITYAVELYVPPGWTIYAPEVSKLRLRGKTDPSGPLKHPLLLSSFGFTGNMSGGLPNGRGRYYACL